MESSIPVRFSISLSSSSGYVGQKKKKEAALHMKRIREETQRQKEAKKAKQTSRFLDNAQSRLEAQLKELNKATAKHLAAESLAQAPFEKMDIDPSIFDSRVGSRPAKRGRKKGSLNFFKQGTLVKKANRIAQLLDRQYIHAKPSAAAAAELEDDNYLSQDEIPDIEWWDRPYTGPEGYKAKKLKTQLITAYIHNPAPMSDIKPEQITQLPLYLTKREKDKIRRKKSKDKHDAMIDEIRLGSKAPPEPKLKLSNIVRVLGSQFIQDPSAAEAKARTQIALRKMKHQLHNENRKLTKAQKSEKT
eukprot:UN25371